MTVFIGLVRGINVGGRARLAMADLRAIAEGCGFTDVRTYVQSGNVVFRASGSAKKVGAELRKAIAAATTLDPAIAMRTARQLATVIKRCPFDDVANVHVAFRVDDAPPKAPAGQQLDATAFAPEEFAVRGQETYLYLPNGLGRSKLAEALARGRSTHHATMRNWHTVTALQAMASSTES